MILNKWKNNVKNDENRRRNQVETFQRSTYFVQGSQIPGDGLTLLRIDQDTVVVVIADFTDQHALLTDGKEPAFQGGNLTSKECQ